MDLSTPIKIGRWTAKPALNVLESAERSVKIEPRTMNVLAYLAARAGEVVSVDELLANVWRGVVVGDGSVYLAIKQLRHALSAPGDDTVYIETIPKRGYRLTVPVERVAAEHATAHDEPEPPLPKRNGEAATEVGIGFEPNGIRQAPAVLMPPPLPAVGQTRSRSRPVGLFAIVAVVAGASLLIGTLTWREPGATAQQPQLHLEFRAPAGAGGFSISPDGSQVVYAASNDGVRSLWLRQLDSGSVRALPGTQGAAAAFWSPDARQIAFVSDTKLRKMSLGSGGLQPLADIRRFGSIIGAWSAHDILLVSTEQYDIARVSAQGGSVEQAALPPSASCVGLPPMAPRSMAPRFLPDGDRFLYLELNCSDDGVEFAIYAGSVTRPERVHVATLRQKPLEQPHVVIQNIDYANGYLLWLLDGALMAQALDAESLQFRGEPIPIAEEVGEFTASQNGVLVYQEWRPMVNADPSAPSRTLARYDRSGRRIGEVRTPARHRLHRVSRDGLRVAVTAPMQRGRIGETDDIWTLDVERGAVFPLTTDQAGDTTPVWSWDGSYLAFNSGRDAVGNRPSKIYRRAADGSGADELLFSAEIDEFVTPLDWSSDNRYIVFARGRYATWRTHGDLWVLPLATGEPAHVLLESPFRKRAARLSPDGRWIAYSTNESGRDQIMVQAFPNAGAGMWQISIDGGFEPRWRGDGRELFYLTADGTVMAVATQTKGDALERGEARPLFSIGRTVSATETPLDSFYDVSANGQQFFVAEPVDAAPTSPAQEQEQTVHVIVNWHAPLLTKSRTE